MTGPSLADRLVEAAAEAVYNGWWDDSEPDESAQWRNLDPDDADHEGAIKSARLALSVLSLLAEAIDDELPSQIPAAALLRSTAVEVAGR